MERAKRAATRCSRYHGPRPLDVVPPEAPAGRGCDLLSHHYIWQLQRGQRYQIQQRRRRRRKKLLTQDVVWCTVHGPLPMVRRAKRGAQMQYAERSEATRCCVKEKSERSERLRRYVALTYMQQVRGKSSRLRYQMQQCCNFTTVNGTSNLLISRNYLWKRLTWP